MTYRLHWIKEGIDLEDDPHVVDLMTRLDEDVNRVVGVLHRVWSWAAKHSDDGRLVGANAGWFDRHFGIDGLAEAMQAVGWLEIGERILVFPEWEKWNDRGNREREQAAKRQQAKRDRDRAAAKARDGASHNQRDERRGTPASPEPRPATAPVPVPVPVPSAPAQCPAPAPEPQPAAVTIVTNHAPDGDGEEDKREKNPPYPPGGVSGAEFPPVLQTREFADAWTNWAEYRREKAGGCP